MGTWGITAFEDDTAMDFYDNFCLEGQISKQLRDAIIKVLHTKYTFSDPELEGFMDPVRALVALEIVAAALGKPIDTYPDDGYHIEYDNEPLPPIHLEYVKKGLSSDVITLGIQCVEKIKNESDIHLNQLWKDSESYDEWVDYLDNLIERLRS